MRPSDATHIRQWDGVLIYLKVEVTPETDTRSEQSKLFVWEDEVPDTEPYWEQADGVTPEYVLSRPEMYERIQ